MHKIMLLHLAVTDFYRRVFLLIYYYFIIDSANSSIKYNQTITEKVAQFLSNIKLIGT